MGRWMKTMKITVGVKTKVRKKRSSLLRKEGELSRKNLNLSKNPQPQKRKLRLRKLPLLEKQQSKRQLQKGELKNEFIDRCR
jgi:hypothetical protein